MTKNGNHSGKDRREREALQMLVCDESAAIEEIFKNSLLYDVK